MGMSLLQTENQSFADQMRSLVEEAERQQLAELPQVSHEPLSLLQMLRPLVLGIEALSRATAEQGTILRKIESAASVQHDLPGLMNAMQETIDRKNSVNQQLFDALYGELRGFKDGFLLEVLHKPIIRDLITLYDDLAEVNRQLGAATAEKARTKASKESGTAIKNVSVNLDHVLHSLLEILARMDVQIVPCHAGKLDKHMQRAISVELAADPSEDGDVVRSVKPGFTWKEKIFRPEEVVMKKWKEGFLERLPTDSQP
jgi:hypothetical protein